MEKICNYNNCTGCNGCINFCPKKAISMKYDQYDICYPKIDKEKCIECGICRKICPNNNKALHFNTPKKVFAAWNKNKDDRNQSASGGVATCLQEYALMNNTITYGVAWKNEYQLEFKKINSIEELKEIRNSKYLYSNTKDIYFDIKRFLDEGKKVLFVGMPCQVAGLKSGLQKDYNNLITVDIVCHGMPSEKYFEAHIKSIKQKKNISNINNITFRNNNIFDISINNKIKLKENRDLYLVGYHKGILYRKSCYSCKYTKCERIGDITLADFWGLENDKKLQKEVKNGISAVLINTKKGEELFEKISSQLIYKEKTLEEVIKYNGQLKHPVVEPDERNKFLKLYKKYGFEYAAKKAFRKRIILENISFTIKKIVKKMLPRNIVLKIKNYKRQINE